jgi:predicted metal-dependent phosphoesterase TrpH
LSVVRPDQRIDTRSELGAWADVRTFSAATHGSCCAAALPRPGQGLLISRRLYDKLGGHRADQVEAERDLIRRLGRRRLVMLGSGAVSMGG